MHSQDNVGKNETVEEEFLPIIDYGGQYTHLINRRIRDLGVVSEIIPYDKVEKCTFTNAAGIILSGGPQSVGDDGSPSLSSTIRELILTNEIPVLGICYGHQLLGHLFDGNLMKSSSREYGSTKISHINKSRLLNDISIQNVWMSHADQITDISDQFIITAKSNTSPIVAMESVNGNIFGVQFHPEVTHTDHGTKILERFVKDICQMKSDEFNYGLLLEKIIQQIRDEVNDSRVLLGVSGGVDSLVASLLLKQAIGSNLYPVFIDLGLLRKNEVHDVIQYYENIMEFENFSFVDASDKFLDRLKGVDDPEEKRRIIGHTFIETFEETAKTLAADAGNFTFLGQGTIYTDRIESGEAGTGAAKIKSHHNLTLPVKMDLTIIEPLKDLYKDEVRIIGKLLNAPQDLLDRYPFPGPGLAVRILGDITREKIRILQEADHVFMTHLKEVKDVPIWQAFAVLLEGKAVGVQGDNRSYGNIIALRAVDSHEGMTADFAKLPLDFLGTVATKIINDVHEVTRVVYDISTKPPATIEFE